MRNIIGIFVVALLVSTTLNAQQKREQNQKKSHLSTEQTATLQTKRMTLNFDLNENQQKEIYALKKKQAEERQQNAKGFRQNRKNGERPTNDERFELRNNRLDNQLENKAAMKKILSKEQFEKWDNFDKKNKAQKHRITKRKNIKGDCTERGSRNTKEPRRQFQNKS